MNKSFDINAYFASVLRKDAEALRLFFLEDAVIRWHNTNEAFTVDEFIRANCEYPGRWTGEIERVLRGNDESPNGTAVESAAEKIVLAASVGAATKPYLSGFRRRGLISVTMRTSRALTSWKRLSRPPAA